MWNLQWICAHWTQHTLSMLCGYIVSSGLLLLSLMDILTPSHSASAAVNFSDFCIIYFSLHHFILIILIRYHNQQCHPIFWTEIVDFEIELVTFCDAEPVLKPTCLLYNDEGLSSLLYTCSESLSPKLSWQLFLIVII